MKKLLLALFLSVNISNIFAQNVDDEIFINETWGNHFSFNKTPEGEILTIAACASDSSSIYLYNMANRSISVFDSMGEFQDKISLQSIGRATYVGDDFIIINKKAVFLNTVDKRLEYFNLSDGSREKSVPYPHDYFENEFSQRNRRFINRIFIDQGVIFLGNSHALFQFNQTGLEKRSHSKAIMRSPPNRGVLLYNSKEPVTKEHGSIHWKGKKIKKRASHYPLLGKAFAISGKNLITCTVNPKGVQIFRTR